LPGILIMAELAIEGSVADAMELAVKSAKQRAFRLYASASTSPDS